MKIITLHSPIHIHELFNILQHKLNALFQERRQVDINFTISGHNDVIEISQHDLYDGVLFKLEIVGQELHITRNEHYVDDVNSLTVESILNDLFADVAGKRGTDLVQEG
ncbi:hypothetical protein [Mucilaginibacter ginsenosidivorax]|uniref:Uncharacterized protein n=1 Tax=Mucilaginibacter ginsenosidivorax TaxID=862126 RepID=A0A5B8VVY4_9SPHI|nr:hypothetical protein [Mucilaginibacter ginsenosidivorax]QEC75834.1 hypothetical protein FSB76_07660 [Mucilaginibacter ginsenosidivorax]